MKKFLRLIVLTLSILCVMQLFPQTSKAQVDVSLSFFYNNLSSYGRWIDNHRHGHVWVPRVEVGFQPYMTAGHWVYTEYGWTWVSDYPWGWAPFHYGRWDFDNEYGWIWIPDYEWGPAWVVWRHSTNYYGWAPLGPGISISIAFGNGYEIPTDRWVFVHEKYMGRSHIGKYYSPRVNNAHILRGSNVISNFHTDGRTNVRYMSGPDRTEVQRYSGKNIKQISVMENSSPGHRIEKGKLWTYRPDFKNERKPQTPNNPKPIPDRKINSKPRNQGNVGHPQNNSPRRDVSKPNNPPRNNDSKPNNPPRNNVSKPSNPPRNNERGEERGRR